MGHANTRAVDGLPLGDAIAPRSAGGARHCALASLEMQPSPQALPFLQILQHSPASRRPSAGISGGPTTVLPGLEGASGSAGTRPASHASRALADRSPSVTLETRA